MLKVLSNVLCDLDPKVKVIGQKAGICDGVPSTSALVSYFFTPRFFCDYTFSYCLKPSGMCLHIYSLPSSAFLKYQTSGLYCT